MHQFLLDSSDIGNNILTERKITAGQRKPLFSICLASNAIIVAHSPADKRRPRDNGTRSEDNAISLVAQARATSEIALSSELVLRDRTSCLPSTVNWPITDQLGCPPGARLIYTPREKAGFVPTRPECMPEHPTTSSPTQTKYVKYRNRRRWRRWANVTYDGQQWNKVDPISARSRYNMCRGTSIYCWLLPGRAVWCGLNFSMFCPNGWIPWRNRCRFLTDNTNQNIPHTKPKSSIYLLAKQAHTTFWLCTAI